MGAAELGPFYGNPAQPQSRLDYTAIMLGGARNSVTIAFMTLYALKPRFQGLLRPLVGWLAGTGVTANQVTVAAAAGSVAVAGIVIWNAEQRPVFLLLPAW